MNRRYAVFKLMIFLHLLLVSESSTANSNLVDAVRSGNLSTVRELLKVETDIDQRADRFTPLGLAAIRGDLFMVDLLLDKGADPDAVSLNGANALSLAVRSCRATAKLISRLIDAGADLENRSGDGITPLQLAVQEELTELALQLIDAGADINTLNPFGEGILNYAIYTRNNRLIRRALELGVNTDQLAHLFTTVDYDPPGMGDAKAHHSVLCGGSRESSCRVRCQNTAGCAVEGIRVLRQKCPRFHNVKHLPSSAEPMRPNGAAPSTNGAVAAYG